MRPGWPGLALCLATLLPAAAQTATDGSWVVRNVRFKSGEVLPELRLHYTTVGNTQGEPVLLLHGTAGHGTTGQARWWKAELDALLRSVPRLAP